MLPSSGGVSGTHNTQQLLLSAPASELCLFGDRTIVYIRLSAVPRTGYRCVWARSPSAVGQLALDALLANCSVLRKYYHFLPVARV